MGFISELNAQTLLWGLYGFMSTKRAVGSFEIHGDGFYFIIVIFFINICFVFFKESVK